MRKIKPCPFCENDALFVSERNNKSYVRCGKCYAYGPDGKDKEEAIERWNAAPREEDVEIKKCHKWEEKESKSTPLNPENSSVKPFIDLARDELDVIRALETKVNEYQMAAEEAAELAQAMLKYCRMCGHGSWTPLNPKDAEDAVIEEYADLLLAMEASFPRCEGNKRFYNNLERVYKKKSKRWAERLKNHDD